MHVSLSYFSSRQVHSYLIGEWLAEDPRTNTIKTRIEKKIYTTPSHFTDNSTLKKRARFGRPIYFVKEKKNTPLQ
jgi:hypothetical protein